MSHTAGVAVVTVVWMVLLQSMAEEVDLIAVPTSVNADNHMKYAALW